MSVDGARTAHRNNADDNGGLGGERSFHANGFNNSIAAATPLRHPFSLAPLICSA
jgi:hypothetical protein